MRALVVTNPFVRVNPLTGVAEMHNKGDHITHIDRINDLDNSEHGNHFTAIHLPDDHEHDERNADPVDSEEDTEN